MTKQNINIDLSQTSEIVCSECGNQTFIQSFYIRRLSAILSPNGQESLIPIPVFECSSCGNINAEFKPKLTDTDINAEDTEQI